MVLFINQHMKGVIFFRYCGASFPKYKDVCGLPTKYTNLFM